MHLLIVFHSQSARAQSLALAAYSGSFQEAGVVVTLKRAIDATGSDVLNADALLIITPENFAAASGGIKDFFDRMYYPFLKMEKAGLPYAIIISAGNDGTGCERQLDKIMTGMKARKVQPTTIVYGIPVELHLKQCSELAQCLATGLSMGIF